MDAAALRLGGQRARPSWIAVGRDLTALAREGQARPAHRPPRAVAPARPHAGAKKKNNPVLVGLAGVGKTAIVEGLAALIAAGQIPDELKDCRLVELPMAALVAGTTYRGQFEERLLGLVKEVKAAANVILFIDEIPSILRAGAVEGGSLDAGNILKPALARGDLHVIGATTPEEYQRYITQDAALERRFQQVWGAGTAAGRSVGDAQGRQAALRSAPRCGDRRRSAGSRREAVRRLAAGSPPAGQGARSPGRSLRPCPDPDDQQAER